MPQKDKDYIKDSFLYTGLFLFMLASINIPLLHLIILWILPFPFLVLRVKQPISAMIVPLVGIFILYLYGFPLLYILLGLLAWFIGLGMGNIYRRTDSTGTDVVLGGLVSGLVASWITMGLMQWAFDFFDVLKSAWQNEWIEAQRILNQSGIAVPEVVIPPIGVFVLVFLLLILVPMILISFVVTRKWLVYKGYPRKALPPFHEWRLPKVFFYFFLLVLLAEWFVAGDGGLDANDQWMIGIVFVLQVLFFIQGLAFLDFLLKQKKKSRMWLALAVLMAWLPPISFIILLLGVVDVGTSLRIKLQR
ncbi:DUF2232 domain-containing protein [Thermoactinomyces mirandus]|uniref:DUF2232 domain-containing protein n=1 Tax=Thermoactinomyces mirandus TaxID=2756294 RepID=A0A7W1XT99_9BACL|nr:DUF2232 domain-containing protein [Thermoactinomyces mirandus]MBA4602883.1 DUF2232 domain-containing protein [Thermoactinomyces mirandus]